MFRFFIGPVIIGILVFVSIYFVSPVIISESSIVSIVDGFVVNSANFYFQSMPTVIADFAANLNLAKAALTVALLATVVIQLLAIIWGLLSYVAKWITRHLRGDGKKDEPRDLPSIDMDSDLKTSSIGNGVFGRGLDSIDRDL
jgi:hypothetical protein